MAVQGARFYRPGLDILRLCAFLAVFVTHSVPDTPAYFASLGAPAWAAAWLGEGVQSGNYGVDLFFVLSAYLITELLLREIALTGKLDIRAFYIRRALRIWPLYFLFLAASFWIIPYWIPQHFESRFALAFVFFAGNWTCTTHGFPGSVATPLWSISIEEQFYLAWPWVIHIFRASRLVWAAAGLAVTALAVRLFLLAHPAQHPAVWCNTFARLDPIAAGVLIALWLRGARPSLSKAARIGLLLGAPLMWVGVSHFTPVFGPPTLASMLIGYPGIAAGSAALVAAFLSSDVTTLPAILKRPLLYLGRISYGLYVFHPLALHLAGGPWKLFSPVDTLTRMLHGLALTVVFATISYYALERPFLRWKLSFTRVPSRPGG